MKEKVEGRHSDGNEYFQGHNVALCPPDNVENESRWVTATN
jgi:hypothetical protein